METQFRKLAKIALRSLFISVTMFVTATIATAQILTPNEEFEKSLRPPLDVQGQIVGLRLIPAAGETEVLVTGIPADELAASEVGLRARVRVGEDFEPVTTTSVEDGSFIVDAPLTGTSEMQIDVKVDDETETIEVRPQRD